MLLSFATTLFTVFVIGGVPSIINLVLGAAAVAFGAVKVPVKRVSRRPRQDLWGRFFGGEEEVWEDDSYTRPVQQTRSRMGGLWNTTETWEQTTTRFRRRSPALVQLGLVLLSLSVAYNTCAAVMAIQILPACVGAAIWLSLMYLLTSKTLARQQVWEETAGGPPATSPDGEERAPSRGWCGGERKKKDTEGTRWYHYVLVILFLAIGLGGEPSEAYQQARCVKTVEALYQQHSPTKMARAPGLCKQYKGREQKLLNKLNRKYAMQKKTQGSAW